MDSRFGPEVREEIIEKLESGDSMRTICDDPRMPDRRTVERWQNEDTDFAAAIARAREAGYDRRAENAVDAAKSASDPQKGRLAFDAERWYLSKLAPRRYGDKLDLTSGNEPLRQLSDEDLDKRIAAKAQAINAR
ncbi:terminase small subunit-like protein [Sphingomonas melonis]|uniref:Terminase small subunit protein n=1 Tax=Sphingomonas melonis TaxID=152682 RepID=A0A7Y9FK23_9SPHN|nr:hypothetical protein [Sphingomonas melonis]NYD88765.1 hypothetical protein [Sphingomonas melonis]